MWKLLEEVQYLFQRKKVIQWSKSFFTRGTEAPQRRKYLGFSCELYNKRPIRVVILLQIKLQLKQSGHIKSPKVIA